MAKNKSYYVDFAGFIIMATSEHNAQKRAEKYIKDGIAPKVCSIELTDDPQFTEDEVNR